MAFSRSMFGYDKEDVDRKLQEIKDDAERNRRELAAAQARVAELEAHAEEDRVMIAALRRQRSQTETDVYTFTTPLVIMVGPSHSLSMIASLMDDIENLPHFTADSRVFKDGFYRVNGQTSDADAVVQWHQRRSDVRAVTRKGDAIQVVPKGKFT